MSLAPLRNAALFSFATLGTAFVVSYSSAFSSSKTEKLATAMRANLDEYNANVAEDLYTK
jgi:hypothetical protein